MTNADYFLTDYRKRFPKWLKHHDLVTEMRVIFQNPQRKPLITFGRIPTDCFKTLAKHIDEPCTITTCFYLGNDSKQPWMIYTYNDGQIHSTLLNDDRPLIHKDPERLIENIIYKAQQSIAN